MSPSDKYRHNYVPPRERGLAARLMRSVAPSARVAAFFVGLAGGYLLLVCLMGL